MIEELLQTINRQARVLDTLPGPPALTITPEHSGWNGAQCIQHMNISTELYLRQIERKLDSLRPASGPYKPGFLAEQFIRGLAPDKKMHIRYKMKTMKVLEPGNPDPEEAVERLKHNLERMLNIIDRCKGKDMRSFKVNTVFGPILKFYLGDALRFINAHNERHFLQLERILAAVRDSSVPA